MLDLKDFLKKMTARIYKNKLKFSDKIYRFVWSIFYLIFFKALPNKGFNRLRIIILKIFGSSIGYGCRVASSAKIWMPKNLILHNYVAIAEDVDCYCVDIIEIGSYSTISQRSFLCTASHVIDRYDRPLVYKNIKIGEYAWVAAESFIGPGVKINNGGVALAKSLVIKNIDENTVVGGNPAIVLKKYEPEQPYESNE